MMWWLHNSFETQYLLVFPPNPSTQKFGFFNEGRHRDVKLFPWDLSMPKSAFSKSAFYFP